MKFLSNTYSVCLVKLPTSQSVQRNDHEFYALCFIRLLFPKVEVHRDTIKTFLQMSAGGGGGGGGHSRGFSTTAL